MFKIGCHLSSSKGYLHMGREALEIGGNTFQFFTRNPRGGAAKAIDEADVQAFNALPGIEGVLAHAPYTVNPCSDNEKTREFALITLADDLCRMERTPFNLYNLHPGSHVGQGVDKGVELIADALNAVLKKEQTTTVLLETMAGKGSEIGGSFEELRRIIDKVAQKDKLAVCLDTCHVYDAGYDILNDLDGVLHQFDETIGLSLLKAIHLNDSKNPFFSHKDRHEKIGQGALGLDFFRRIINHEKLKGVPFYLETPNELPGYREEIALLKSLYVQ